MSLPAAVRRARPEDLKGIMALEDATPEAPQWTEAMYREYLQAPAEGPQHKVLLVASTEAHLGGFAAASLVADEAELESIVVAASARRSGVGSALLSAVESWARKYGAQALLLEVRSSNRSAQAFYAALGFRPAGVRPAYYKGPAEDAVLLRLDLDERRITTQSAEAGEL